MKEQTNKSTLEVAYHQELLAEMGRIAKIGGWEFDVKTGMGTWTDETARIHDIDPDIFTTKDIGISYYPDESRLKIEQAIAETIKNGTPYDLELELISAKGVHKWVRTIGSPIYQKDKVVKLRGSFQDITDFKIQQQKIAANEEYLRITLNSIGDAVLSTDLEGRIAGMNPIAEELTGWKFDQAKGLMLEKVFDIVNAQTGKRPENPVRKALETGVIVGLANHTKLLAKNGKEYQIADSAAPIKDSNGKTIGVVMVFRNVSEEYDMREKIDHLNLALKAVRNVNQLITKEKDLEKLIKGACENLIETRGFYGAWIAILNDPTKKVRTASAGFGEEFESFSKLLEKGDWIYPCRKCLDRPGVLLIKNPVKTCSDCPLVSQYHNRSVMSVRLEHEKSVFGLMSVSLPSQVASDPEEQSLLKEIADDIAFAIRSIEKDTEHKKSEQALRQNEARMKSIFKATPVGIGLLLNRNFLEVNDYLCQMVGYAQEELIGKNARMLYDSQEDFDFVGTEKYRQIGITGTGIVETRFKTKSGDIRHILLSSTYLDPENQEAGVTFSALDITEKRHYEQRLIEAKEKAEESDRLKSAFLQNMSHEIRTPMNGILGFMELLKEPDLSGEEKEKYIDIIDKSGERLLNTINNIIELSRIESGQTELHLAEVKTNEVLQYYLEFFTPRASANKLKLNLLTQVDEHESVIVTDRRILESIITNLVNNAIKFTPAGSIEFGSYRENNHLVFFVRDTGIGIPNDRIDAIFQRFVQADLNLSRPHEGSGLGLSIVKAYVDLIQGKIWVESATGKGSTFRFSIPYPV
jgi:PAS domain S-box-containing protein